MPRHERPPLLLHSEQAWEVVASLAWLGRRVAAVLHMSLWWLIFQEGLKVVVASFPTSKVKTCLLPREYGIPGTIACMSRHVDSAISIETPCVVLYLFVLKAERPIMVPA